MLCPYSGLAFCSSLMRFLDFFLAAADEVVDFFLGGAWHEANGGSSRSLSSMSSAARFRDVFLPLPSPSVINSPTKHLVMKVRI